MKLKTFKGGGAVKRIVLRMLACFFEKSAYLYANSTCTGRFFKAEIPKKLKKEREYHESKEN